MECKTEARHVVKRFKDLIHGVREKTIEGRPRSMRGERTEGGSNVVGSALKAAPTTRVFETGSKLATFEEGRTNRRRIERDQLRIRD